MWKHPQSLLGWSTPFGLGFDHASLARALRIEDNESHCKMRRFGRCHGREFCADCPWSENDLQSRARAWPVAAARRGMSRVPDWRRRPPPTRVLHAWPRFAVWLSYSASAPSAKPRR